MKRLSLTFMLLCSTAMFGATAQAQTATSAQTADQSTSQPVTSESVRVDALETELKDTNAKLEKLMELMQQQSAAVAPSTPDANAASATQEPVAAGAIAPTATVPTAKLKPGYVIRIAGVDTSAPATISQATFGQVYSTADSLSFGGAEELLGFDPGAFVAYEISGLLPIETSGNYTFLTAFSQEAIEGNTDSSHENTCFSSLRIDEKVIVDGDIFELGNVYNANKITHSKAVALERGEYQFSAYLVCTSNEFGRLDEPLPGINKMAVGSILLVAPGQSAQPISKALFVEESAS